MKKGKVTILKVESKQFQFDDENLERVKTWCVCVCVWIQIRICILWKTPVKRVGVWGNMENWWDTTTYSTFLSRRHTVLQFGFTISRRCVVCVLYYLCLRSLRVSWDSMVLVYFYNTHPHSLCTYLRIFFLFFFFPCQIEKIHPHRNCYLQFHINYSLFFFFICTRILFLPFIVFPTKLCLSS